MVRLPRGWGAYFHAPAPRPGGKLRQGPGWRGTGMQAAPPIPIQRYTSRVSGVPLTGGQNQAAIPAGGTLTLSVGPQGLGTTWYPAQVTLSTTTGPLDTATANVWIGSQGVPVTLAGTIYTGNGVLALAIPPMQPGQVLIVTWTGATPGNIAGLNVTGTMDALTTG